MSRRQTQLQKLWEELILDNLEDLVKSATNSLDSAIDSVKDAAGNINSERAALNASLLEAMESMDREKLELWLREAVRSLDTEKLERWARHSLAKVDAGQYRRLTRNRLGRLDKDKLDDMLKEGLRLVDRHKLEERLRSLDIDKLKQVARKSLNEFDPHKIEEFVGARVDKVIRTRLDALSAAELEALLKDKSAALKKAVVVDAGKAVTKKSAEVEVKRGKSGKPDKVTKDHPNPIAKLVGTSFRLGLLSAAGWIAYSHLFLEHQVPLPKAIAAELFTVAYRPSGPINIYQDRTGSGRPLVLIHSINAAASSYEMRPIFQQYRGKRPVFALDLPGFGFSARADIDYTPEIYVNAILTTLTGIDAGPADVVALSLSSEFAAEAARRRPELFHSLTLISPSGLYQRENGGPFDDLAYPLLSFRLWARPFFDLLTTRQGIAYFLQKSFIGAIPDGMVDYSIATSHQPGAEHAPLYFVAGKLFTPNAIERIYKLVKTPTLVIFDRDAYVRFDRLPELLATNKAWQATRVGPSMGLPQWEKGSDTIQAIEAFWYSVKEPLKMPFDRPHRLLALDLDDTLLRSDGTIFERTINALNAWRNAGHVIAIATGRPTRSVTAVLPELLQQVPWITYNGAYVYFNGHCIYENLIAPAATHSIISLVAETLPECAVGLEIDDILFLNRTINRTSPYQVVDLTTVAHQPAAKILFFHQEFATLEVLLTLLPSDTRAMVSEKYNLVQILAHNADKTHALRYLVTHLGLDMADVVAIGDDINDVDMIRDSGLGVAVSNAVPAVIAVANRITLSNDEDGVALVIEELLEEELLEEQLQQ